MRSPLLVGVGLAIAAGLLGTLVYVLSLQSNLTPSKSATAADAPSKQLAPSSAPQSGGALGVASNPVISPNAVTSPNAASPTLSIQNRSTASPVSAGKAAEAKVRQDRRQAMQELSNLLMNADKSKPEEVRAAFKKIESTLPDEQSKQQIILASRTYEYGYRLQALTKELATLNPIAKKADKERQQGILAEITEIQSKIQAAATATRKFAESKLKEQR